MKKLIENSECGTLKIKFHGIDGWNRPVFKAVGHDLFYGSVDKLFDTEVKSVDIPANELLYFGSYFGCEPMGSRPKYNLEIVKDDAKIIGVQR